MLCLELWTSQEEGGDEEENEEKEEWEEEEENEEEEEGEGMNILITYLLRSLPDSIDSSLM